MISGGTPIADFSRRSVKSYVCAVWHPQVLSLTEERNSKIRRHGWEPITFSEEEEKGIIFPHSDPMIIRADIADFDVGRILIDTGINCPTAYNAIIDRTALTRMKAILSPHRLLLKFPTPSGISQVRGDQLSARMCYVSSTEESATRASGQRAPETLIVTRPGMPNGNGGTECPDEPRDDNVAPQA
ncbi:unnamed protein product [Prunus brigantina]